MTKSKKRALKPRVMKKREEKYLESSEDSYFSDSEFEESSKYNRRKRKAPRLENKKSNFVFTSFDLDFKPKSIEAPDSKDFPDYVKAPNSNINNYQKSQVQCCCNFGFKGNLNQ